MITEELSKELYKSLNDEQKLKLILYNDFGGEAREIFDWLNPKNNASQPVVGKTETLYSDGVYYIYEDGSCELFDYNKQNAPQKAVKRIGVKMGEHSLAIDMEDLPAQPLTNAEDCSDYEGYVEEYDDAVADWNGKSNTEHIKEVGTGIELKDDEWIPSVAELYLIYLNKRSINAAIELGGGSRIKDGWYWSSTEFSATYAWFLYLSNGNLNNWGTKVSYSGYVRAVAAFH